MWGFNSCLKGLCSIPVRTSSDNKAYLSSDFEPQSSCPEQLHSTCFGFFLLSASCVGGISGAFQGHRAVLTELLAAGVQSCRAHRFLGVDFALPERTLCESAGEDWRPRGGDCSYPGGEQHLCCPFLRNPGWSLWSHPVFSVHFQGLVSLTVQRLCWQWVSESPFWKLKMYYYFTLLFWNLLDQWFYWYYGFSTQGWF